MLIQSLKMAWNSIKSNKMRSFLTMLGIIIGVMALVVLVSLVNGATTSVTDTISSMGTNLLTVSLSDDKGDPIKLSELSDFVADDTVGEVSPVASTSLTAKDGDNEETATVYGTTGSYADIEGLTLQYGRFIKNTDIDNHSNVIIINYDMAVDVVGSAEAAMGAEIQLDGVSYTVVGVLEEEESTSALSSLMGESYTADIPYTSLIRLTDTISSSITSFVVSASSDDEIDAAETAVTNKLLARFQDDDDAFTVTNQNTIAETMDSVVGMMELLLGGIAAISLLVGGIGIMNIMLVSVTERTREIGIRKAIGAGRRTILMQFLIEALLISLIGCGIGILFSWITLQIVTVAAASTGMTFTLALNVVVISIAFSVGIGIIFGLYPANKAAKKNPIEALRYMG